MKPATLLLSLTLIGLTGPAFADSVDSVGDAERRWLNPNASSQWEADHIDHTKLAISENLKAQIRPRLRQAESLGSDTSWISPQRCAAVHQSVVLDLPQFCLTGSVNETRLRDFSHQLDILDRCGIIHLRAPVQNALGMLLKGDREGCAKIAPVAVEE